MRTQLAAAAVAALALGTVIGIRPSFAKSATPAVDPDAVAALHKMGDFLRQQQKFTVHATATTDDLLSSGQKVQFNGTIEMMVRRPDRLRVDARGDRQNEHLYYDGKNFTLYGERVGYYATFAAPPTLAELKDEVEKRGIELPLADLFYWGTERDGTKELTAATNVGVSTVEGTACDHYAFRQKDVDWEIWIEQGPHPLPRKMVITTTSEKSRPQHSVVMNWDLSPQLGDELFTFAPPAEAHKIEFESATAARAARRQSQ
ncbi:MAG TPA: DUF2092 domain-containing protein [Polyangia bacterium]|nr:DUF2092 domain-containing protein [Polyangia bacterium]